MNEIKIEIDLGEKTIEIPIKIIPINFRNVTKTSNCGLNTEYIVKNEEIDIIGRGSTERLATENFKREYQSLMKK